MLRSPEEIRPVVVMLIACSYSDITKLRGAFHDYMNAPHPSVHTQYGGWDSIIGIVTMLWDTPAVVQIATIPRDFSSPEHL